MALDTAQLTEMLRVMILIREFDELAIKLRVAGKIYGAVHPYVGQEAVAVGVCSNLATTDRVTSTHRGHGHCIAKGADIRKLTEELGIMTTETEIDALVAAFVRVAVRVRG